MSDWLVCNVTENSVLARQRDKLGLTQEEVAKRAGITLKQYQRYERPNFNISTASSFRITNAVLTALELDANLFRQGEYVFHPLPEEQEESMRKAGL